MAPYYESLCKELKWQLDSDLLSKMKKANEEELKRLDDVLEDAEKNLGESEIRDVMMAKAEYLIRIGDKVCFQSSQFPGRKMNTVNACACWNIFLVLTFYNTYLLLSVLCETY